MLQISAGHSTRAHTKSMIHEQLASLNISEHELNVQNDAYFQALILTANSEVIEFYEEVTRSLDRRYEQSKPLMTADDVTHSRSQTSHANSVETLELLKH